MALLAFGPGVFKPSDGKVPEAASKAYTWISSPDYPLPLAYEVDLRIIGSAILGASLVSYLLKASAHPYSVLHLLLHTLGLGCLSTMWQIAARALHALAATCYTLAGLDITASHCCCCLQCHDGLSDACPFASRLSHSMPTLDRHIVHAYGSTFTEFEPAHTSAEGSRRGDAESAAL